MIQRNALCILLCTLMAPQLYCWPQRRTPRQHSTQPSSILGSSPCNMTFIPETRVGRPCFPDPKIEGDEAAKERSDRVIFPGPSKNSPPSRQNTSPPIINFPDSESNNNRTDNSQNQTPKINFPDTIVSRTGVPPDSGAPFVPILPPTPRGPSCAAGSTFCVDVDNYPSDLVAHLINNEVQSFNEYFGDDTSDTNITNRIDASEDAPLCASFEEFVYPKLAMNKDSKWLYIVNQDQFIQGIRVEKCMKDGSACALTETLPIGYKMYCKQKYIYRKLLSVNEDGKALSDSFRFPSCCACYYRMMGSIASRFGSGTSNVTPARGRGTSAAGNTQATQLPRPSVDVSPNVAVNQQEHAGARATSPELARTSRDHEVSSIRQQKSRNDAARKRV